MAFGGSASDQVLGGNWPTHLARLINERAAGPSLVMSGGCGAYNFNSVMLKFWRDSPALMPDIVVSCSGINDIEFVHGHPEHPSLHRQQVRIAHALVDANAVGASLLGLPYNVSNAENWLRIMRMMMATDIGCRFFTFLQPAMGLGPFDPGSEER